MREGESLAGFRFTGLRTRTVPPPRFAAGKRKHNRFETEAAMPAPSLSTPPACSRELVDRLHSVAATIDDCKWVANALHLSASSADESAAHEANTRMAGVSRMLFTVLRKASNDILNLVEVLENRKGAKS